VYTVSNVAHSLPGLRSCSHCGRWLSLACFLVQLPFLCFQDMVHLVLKGRNPLVDGARGYQIGDDELSLTLLKPLILALFGTDDGSPSRTLCVRAKECRYRCVSLRLHVIRLFFFFFSAV
jgi:hypothetical protein